jgi:hypothetical protein
MWDEKKEISDLETKLLNEGLTKKEKRKLDQLNMFYPKKSILEKIFDGVCNVLFKLYCFFGNLFFK